MTKGRSKPKPADPRKDLEGQKSAHEYNQAVLQNLAEIVSQSTFKGFQARAILDCQRFVDELLQQTEKQLADVEEQLAETGEQQ